MEKDVEQELLELLCHNRSARKELMNTYIESIDNAEFDEMCFYLFSPKELQEIWDDKNPMTAEAYQQLAHIFGQMESAHLTAQLVQRFGQAFGPYIINYEP